MANQSTNVSISSGHPCQNQTDRLISLLATIYTLLGIRVAFSIGVLIANLKLLYVQRKAHIWFEADRPLILGILVSNVLGATAIILTGLSRFTGLIFDLKLSTQSSHLLWLTIISDGSMFSLILYIAAIAGRNYIGIRYFYETPNPYGIGRTGLVALSIMIMLFALTLSFFGLNSHQQAIINETNFAMDASFFVGCVIIQVVTAVTLYKIKGLSQKMQHDFAVNRVQQQLELRVSLYRTIERTQALIPLCTINVAMWITLWVANFIVDQIITSTQPIDCTQRSPESIIWLAIMDITGSIYGLLYPHMLTRRKEPLRTILRKAVCCVYELTEISVSDQSPKSIAVSGSKKSNHWTAMDAQWNNVERAMKAPQVPKTTVKIETKNKVSPANHGGVAKGT